MRGGAFRGLVIPDFVKGAIFTAILLGIALGFASHKTPEQQKEDGSHYGEVVSPASEPGPTKQEGNPNQGKEAIAERGPLDALADWLLDVKLSDFLLIGFTAVLAWKTAGLDESTRRLWKAGEVQRTLAKRIAADQARDMQKSLRIARLNAEAARKAAEVSERALIASNRAWIKVGVPILDDVLAIDEHRIMITVRIPMENIGQTPALSINPQVWLGFFPQTGFEGEVFAKRCEEFRINPGSLGLSLFPGDKFPGSVNEYGHFALAQRNEMERNLWYDTTVPRLQVLLMGCITYRFPSDTQSFHQTRFIYRIITPKHVGLDPVGIPADQVRLMRFDFFSGFSAD